MKRLKLFTVFLVCVVLVQIIHGNINMKMMCKKIDKEIIVSDEIRNISMSKNDAEKIYLTDTSVGGVEYISGINDGILHNIIYRKLYTKFSDNKFSENKGQVPYLFRKIADKKTCEDIYGLYKTIFEDVKWFPVPDDYVGKVKTSYENTWDEARNYGGERKHEGVDIMAGNNERGYFPVVSMTDGVVEKKGWLELGGYRIGIRSPGGIYFYYAHLAEYAEGIEEGSVVKAGDIIGTMGDSGYGKEEGTTGKFDVHLHLGIYANHTDEQGVVTEISYNPYYILKAVENFKKDFVDNNS